MRSKTWSDNEHRRATIEAFTRAVSDGAHSLATDIEIANSGENLASGWEPINFQAIRDEVTQSKQVQE